MKKPRLVNRHSAESIRFVEILINESLAVFLRQGEIRSDAEKLSRSFALEVARQLKGSLVYFSKNTINQAQTKYKFIRDDYRGGKTIKQLSENYNLSERRIYTILFEIKDDDKAQSANTTAQLMAVAAVRMFISIGFNQNDAKDAARGLLAVITAKFGGKCFHIPRERNIRRIIRDIDIYRFYKAGKSIGKLAAHFNLSEKDIEAVIGWYPATKITEASISGLTLLKRQVLDVAANCRDSPVIHGLLEAAAANVERAQMVAHEDICQTIISSVKGEQKQCRHYLTTNP